jgi:HEAT repeat protein
VATAVDAGDLDGAMEAYEALRAVDGPDGAVLSPVAALLLEREARSEDPRRRRAALQQLSLAGVRGGPVIRRLAELPGRPPARVGALTILARRGSTRARLALRAFADEADPSLLRASILGMEPDADRDLLLELLGNPDAAVRGAAAEVLRAASAHPAVRAALLSVAPNDPEAPVRAAAVRALGAPAAANEAVRSTLRDRLADPSSAVRMAAVRALVDVDPALAERSLGALLEVAPSPTGIEAARVLAARPGGLAEAALAFLLAALTAPDPALRAQVAVAFAGMPARVALPEARLAAHLATEPDPRVRLGLARGLLEGRPDDAEAALRRLGRGPTSMAQVQAASLLAARGAGPARRWLRAALAHPDPLLRRTAARALARDAGDADGARVALRDPDPIVRIYAAGGILALPTRYDP